MIDTYTVNVQPVTRMREPRRRPSIDGLIDNAIVAIAIALAIVKVVTL